MNIIWMAVALIFPFMCLAQDEEHLCMYERDDKSIKGKVKIVRWSCGRSLNIAELRSEPFYKNWYHVDSFNTLGFKVKSYEVRNGIISNVNGIEYKLDSKGNIIEKREHYENNSDTMVVIIKYNEVGKVVIEKTYGSNGNSKCCMRLIRYTHSDMLTIKEDSISQGTTKTIYKYDEKGNNIEAMIDYRNGQTGTIKYTYDNKGNKASETYRESGYTHTYRYDDHNNEVMRDFNEKTGTGVITEYEYDKNGNWVRCIEDERKYAGCYGDPPYLLRVREIEYY